MKNLIKNLTKKDLKIVERKKLFFIIPLCMLIAGLIAGVIFGVFSGSPLNIGSGLKGGYSLTVTTGEYITSENYAGYKDELGDLFESYTYTYNGEDYGVRLSSISWKGGKEAKDNAIKISYKADKSLGIFKRDKVMDELNTDIKESIYDIVRYQRPVNVEISGSTATLTYSTQVYGDVTNGNLKTTLAASGITADNFTFINDDAQNPTNNKVQFTFLYSGELTKNDLTAAATIDRYFSVSIMPIELTSGTLSMGLVSNIVYATLLILLFSLIFILIRFERATAFSIMSAIFLDLVMVLILTSIFHVQITAAFIGALVAVTMYSLITNMFIFDRVREIRKTVDTSGEKVTASDVANRAIKHTLARNIFVTIASVILLGIAVIVALIGGAYSVATFCVPVIFGLLSTFFSATCFTPSLWVFFKQDKLGEYKQFKAFGQSKKSAKDAVVVATAESTEDINN